MKSVLGVLFSRWVLSFIGTALLAALVWFFGPLLTLLADWIVRLIIIVVMLLVWLGANLLLDWRRRRREAALAEGVTAKPVDPTAEAKAEEVGALQERLSAALS